MKQERERRKLELLAPAANADIAMEAILHGADAVYIGGPSHGARRSAANTIDDIRRVVDFAHIYRAKVYTTVNTIVYDRELPQVERLVTELWRAGVDALIVQDMGLLRLDIPPIALHASTQCDIRTPEKARFLQEAGFSQLVLARELGLDEISRIAAAVDVPLETFVHGALCVSYSGRCHASQACFSRSANRGECAQVCRQLWRLTDAGGRRVAKDAHFLSLKDFNASDILEKLIEAGASSFKIEGRLKEADYVKNVTAYYRQRLDRIIEASEGRYVRSSMGRSELKFTPDLKKSFNRGFTHYFLEERRPTGIWNPLTPKSQGEIIDNVADLRNGDGIAYYDDRGNYVGTTVNAVEHGTVRGPKGFRLPKGVEIHRTFDLEWQKVLSRPTAARRLDLNIELDASGITATDERGCRVRLPLGEAPLKGEKPMDFRRPFEKTGNTPFRLRNFGSLLGDNDFIPPSKLTYLRRLLLDALLEAGRVTYPLELRRKENREAKYPAERLTFADNVANKKAEEFYFDHGVKDIEPALETRKGKQTVRKAERVMTTRHCILRELGMCRRDPGSGGEKLRFPLTIESGPLRFGLEFDCGACEMHVVAQ